MSFGQRRYVRERENMIANRGFNNEQLTANNMRLGFVKDFIIGFDVNLYKTQVERDWAYIAKRQYNYDVALTGLGYSAMVSNVLLIWRSFICKRLVVWPLVAIPFTYFIIFRQSLLQKHAKKLFDMCNIGEEYYLGWKRNEVLRKCNNLLDVQDF